MFMILSSDPILPSNVRKVLIERNNQYRTYELREILPDGSEKTYYIPNRNGKKTMHYHEEFINGQWIYRDVIPFDAYAQFVADILIPCQQSI